MCGVLRGQVRNTSLKRSCSLIVHGPWPSNLNFGLFTRKLRYSRFLVSFPSLCTTVHCAHAPFSLPVGTPSSLFIYRFDPVWLESHRLATAKASEKRREAMSVGRKSWESAEVSFGQY